MTPEMLVHHLLAARLDNRLGRYDENMDAWPHETSVPVMLSQMGWGIGYERPAPITNRASAAGGPGALLAEVA